MLVLYHVIDSNVLVTLEWTIKPRYLLILKKLIDSCKVVGTVCCIIAFNWTFSLGSLLSILLINLIWFVNYYILFLLLEVFIWNLISKAGWLVALPVLDLVWLVLLVWLLFVTIFISVRVIWLIVHLNVSWFISFSGVESCRII